jgi:hypothetical protein
MIVYLCLCQELSYCYVVCHYLRPKMVWTVWFQLMILSFVALFIMSYEIGRVIWIFSCSTVWRVYRFWGYRSHGFQLLSMYFLIDYYCFWNYRNIGAVFVSDNIVSISFSRKKNENDNDLALYRSFLIVFIPSGHACTSTDQVNQTVALCMTIQVKTTKQ